MSAEQIFQSLSHKQRIKVLDLTLPGIEAFLKDVLAKENLSEEGENLRCRYLEILQDSTDNLLGDSSESSPLRTPDIKESLFPFKDGNGIETFTLEGHTIPGHALRVEEKSPIRSRSSRKGTDSTEESGVFFRTQYLPSVSSESQDAPYHRNSDTFESTSSKDTFMSDSEVEFLEWDTDLMEDGYSTGDNIDNVPPNIDLQPNELGEIYAGVLYIREQPGWHKRWVVLTETCLKCYKYKRDDKMLFEIPLRDAKFVTTDRKRSRMYAMTLSIARLKDDITFATTDEKLRHEWVYVINHVTQKLASEESCSASSESNINKVNELPNKDSRDNSDFADRRTWPLESDKNMNVALDQLRLDDEEEATDLDTTLSPSLAQEESFKELQECLPDILTRPKSKSWKGDLSKPSKAQENTQYRKSISFSPSVECQGNEDSSSVPRVKRHGSLANSLTNKAARVRSKLATSFFKKGKKDDKSNQDSSSQSTTFSGYLLRKKGSLWKNRWCVVKDNSLYCYKDFGASLPELELTLEGCGVKSLPDGEGEKPYSFVLMAEKEQLLFSAENDAELEDWLEVLEKEVGTGDDDEIDIYPLDKANSCTDTLVSRDNEPNNLLAADTNFTDKDVKELPKAMKEKELTKGNKEKEKDTGKRSTLLGAIAHKLGKHSSKYKEAHNDDKLDRIRKQIDELDINTEQIRENRHSLEESGPSKEGVMYCQYGDKYVECKLRLCNHRLEVEPQEQSVDQTFQPTTFRLINCIVLDCSDSEGPLAMVVKRNIGEPLYLRAQSLEEFQTWKDAIESASLTTPSSTERLLSNSSSNGEYSKDDIPNRFKISGNSIDGDDVFHSDSAPDLYPPQKTVYVTCNEREKKADPKMNHIRRAYSAGGIDRMRSLHQGYLVYSKKKQSPLRRTFSNVISSLDLAPKQKRSKTFAGLGINAALLLGIKYSSSVYLRVTKELWVQRWCVIQDNNLHFFLNPDDLTPKISIQLAGCSVEPANVKGKNFTFKLSLPSEKTDFYFAVDSDQERNEWMELLRLEGQRSKNESDADLLNGFLLSKVRSESNIGPTMITDSVSDVSESNHEGKGLHSMSKSLMELRRISQQGKEASTDKNGDSIKSSGVLTQRPTSLQEVLQLLQEQQLMQSMGHQRYVRVKKARGNWKKSAAAVLKDAQSNPDSPEAPRKGILKPNEENRETAEPELSGKPRGASTGSVHSNELTEAFSNFETSEELGKRAEEEKLKAVKTETLLRKRRNSLNLEKEVLEKKLGKEEKRDKKTGVKKLLGKESPKDNEEIIRTKKRLDEINLKLADVDHDMQENKTKEAAVMENITVLKTRTLRKSSISGENLMADQAFRSMLDEKRSRYRDSPTGSTSSRDSFEDKTDVYRPAERSSSLHRKGSRNKTSQASLKALEEELLKISPQPPRKKKLSIVKRVSSSSEGSIEDFSHRISPSNNRRASNEASSNNALSQSHDKLYGWNSLDVRKAKLTGSPQTSTKGELLPVVLSSSTEPSLDVADGSSESHYPNAREHRPSLITALSQIKDFEEFLEINRRR